VTEAEGERLNRFLARSGVASRRAADGLIASGAVLVNGRRPPATGQLIDATRDVVTVDGKRVEPPVERTYIVLNKPPGYLVSSADPRGRPTYRELLPAGRRLFSAGRLDMDTRGLLFVTDDGDLADRLAHPRRHVPKEYVAEVEGIPGDADLRRLRAGVDLEDGRTQPAQAELVDVRGSRALVRVVIHEGRNRQVRRMLEAVGHPVRELRRTGFGPLRLGRLKEGAWRRVRPNELAALRKAAGL
jgi:23S rRNA pseudouridine2605 synthase